ncbi:hypothetical protein GCM10011374_11780 [Kocuria dechangensis]|uniref:Uncharacterized protein n=1 Tax=Kocuria dechangensis TaxID=1176249 RepID=A0A917GLH0_9MICC|nr:hypothetical protein [Kocuria dechangensis]GGG50806.1 hypothetical protein GCM10011374_11780 [Kocuria dechangensis]
MSTDNTTGTTQDVNTLSRCHRCGKKYRGRGEWNVEMRRGVPQWILCPDCQSPEENAEAAINEAMLHYGRDSFGRCLAMPKGISL